MNDLTKVRLFMDVSCKLYLKIINAIANLILLSLVDKDMLSIHNKLTIYKKNVIPYKIKNVTL